MTPTEIRSEINRLLDLLSEEQLIQVLNYVKNQQLRINNNGEITDDEAR